MEEGADEATNDPWITPEMDREVVSMWANPNDQEVITTVGGAQLTVQKLQSFAGTADGNEEVLNAFLYLLNTGEYAERMRTHIFNSYFYNKLKDQGYEEVKRWTRAAGETRNRPCVVELGSMIVPIHHTEGRHHWALMEVHQELKAMRCLDSFTTDKTEVVQELAQYVMRERARSTGGGVAGTWKPQMTTVPIPQQNAAGNACGPRTAISAMYLMQQDPEKIDAAENAEIMAPQYERSMRIFVVHCVITGRIPRKFGSAGVSNETAEERTSPDPEQDALEPEEDLADEAFWDIGSEGSDPEATDSEESEEEAPDSDQSESETEESPTEEQEGPEPEPAGVRTPTVSSRDSMLTKTKSRPEKRQRLDSDSENSNCDDSSDEEAEDIVKELTQDLEEAESEEERRTHGDRKGTSKAEVGEERVAPADNRAPAARQSAQKVWESAAGAGEANRGKKRPREEKAPAALEEHAAGAAEGGQRKRKAEGPDTPAHAESDVSAAEGNASGTAEGGAAEPSKAGGAAANKKRRYHKRGGTERSHNGRQHAAKQRKQGRDAERSAEDPKGS